MLVARLATRKAKPNGQYYVTSDEVCQFMKKQKIEDLPGLRNELIIFEWCFFCRYTEYLQVLVDELQKN